MTKRPTKEPYSAEITKPLVLNKALWEEWHKSAAGNPVKELEASGKIDADFMEKYNAKMNLLFDHYEISRSDPERWEEAAKNLAYVHVGGFKSSGRGRPQKWNQAASIELLKDIYKARADIAKEKNCSLEKIKIVAACKRAVKNPKYQKMTPPMTANSMQRRHDEVKKLIGRLLDFYDPKKPLSLANLPKTYRGKATEK